jgi:hypothetical protein
MANKTMDILKIRKNAMERRQNWEKNSPNNTEIDQDGRQVAAAWGRVVNATDGGTQEQIKTAIANAEKAEDTFFAKWKTAVANRIRP